MRWIVTLALVIAITSCGDDDPTSIHSPNGASTVTDAVTERTICDPPEEPVSWACGHGKCCYVEDEDFICCIDDETGRKTCETLLEQLTCP